MGSRINTVRDLTQQDYKWGFITVPRGLKWARTARSSQQATRVGCLKTVYDREIPVNVVDLGLIYSCAITPHEQGGEDLDGCEQAMQKHQIRRSPVIDGEGRCNGIVAQADLALKVRPEKVSKTVAEISKRELAAA